MDKPETLTIKITHDADGWTAHAVEFDIVTTAETWLEAVKDIHELVAYQIDFAMLNNNTDNLLKRDKQEKRKETSFRILSAGEMAWNETPIIEDEDK